MSDSAFISTPKVSAVPSAEEIKTYDTYYNHKGRLALIIASLMIVMLVSSLDQMIFGTALPTIVGELSGSSLMLWVSVAYLLATAITMPVVGRLGDLIGRKWLLIIGVSIFLIGSIVGGLAQNMEWLIIGRAIQGIGGGGLMVSAQGIIGDIIPVAKRSRFFIFIGAVFGLSSVLGPVLGGVFTESSIGWRGAFWMNLPLGALALLFVALFLKAPISRIKAKFDYLGFTALSVAITTLVLFTSWGGVTYDWNSPIIISLIAAFVASVILFVMIENKVSDPIIPLRFFKDKNYTLAAVAGLAIGIGLFGATGYLPTVLQYSHSLGATNSGLLLLPMVAGLIAATVLSGQIQTRTGKYKIFPILGFAFMAVGLLLLSTMQPTTELWIIGVYEAIFGIGVGLTMQVLVLISQQAVPYQFIGTATSTNNLAREIGAVLGAALVGGLFTTHLANQLATNLPADVIKGQGMESITPALIESLPPQIHQVIIEAYNSSLTPIFAYLLPLFIIGFVAMMFIKQKPITDTRVPESMLDEVIEGMVELSPVRVANDIRTGSVSVVQPKYVKNRNGKLVLASLVIQSTVD